MKYSKHNRLANIVIATVLVLQSPCVSGQQTTPILKIGDKIYEHTFTDVLNYPSKTVKISDFRGKWLILDMWGRTCSGCLESFPKMNLLNSELGERVQLIMVGSIGGKNRVDQRHEELLTKTIYNRLARKHNLTFTVAFDSLFYKKVDPASYPHTLIIDPQGIVRAKTGYISTNQIRALLEGKEVNFDRAYSRTEPPINYNDSLPLLTNGTSANGGNDTSYLYRSIVSNWKSGMPSERTIDLEKELNFEKGTGKLEVHFGTVASLYRIAYFGVNSWALDDPKYYYNTYLPVHFETTDSIEERKKRLAYSLRVPKERSSTEYMMEVMRAELDNYFGYKSQLERRHVPVYYLEVPDKKRLGRLRTKGGTPKTFYDKERRKLCFMNTNFDELARFFRPKLTQPTFEPVFDATGHAENFDLELEMLPGEYSDKDDIIALLAKNGIRVVKGTREMDVIVLRDDPLVVKMKKQKK